MTRRDATKRAVPSAENDDTDETSKTAERFTDDRSTRESTTTTPREMNILVVASYPTMLADPESDWN